MEEAEGGAEVGGVGVGIERGVAEEEEEEVVLGGGGVERGIGGGAVAKGAVAEEG